MSQDNYTPLVDGANANAATFNAAFGSLDAAIGDVGSLTVPGTPASLVEAVEELLDEVGAIASLSVGGGTATDLVTAVNELQTILAVTTKSARVLEWAVAGAYEMTNITYHPTLKGVVAGATVKWPDASGGTYTATSTNLTHEAVDAYTITHTSSGKTVTQAAMTRDVWGNVTVKPALTIA